ncbi:LysR family transcriptional regulator [Paraburkholderia graminis]|jgi:DNA-binding transcriptional LysR family regulator|uniref:DNA-binding transcriptional LysR family regulator n=1 Tax=Paraburkholderia graminis TaxID=60548 RepID=A0ABD5CEV9_9BURK|nr:LysR family transcriptional regulator [Paraburkholderia graminis]MDQ0623365.1 DNA-binding transcriptional LysR family regulator [Paraburkholderia graminis]MDR6203661.1 DNA-binding transcriptional LysR family regulator [Paraburkholderia graminis]
MRLDLQSLKLFVAVCERGSIARAAEAENIAPSALSKRMSHLEDALKTALFVRSNKGLELTAAAAALLQHARVVLRDIYQMESELLDHAEGVRGQIRLNASLSTIVQYIANDIRDFLALHPGLRIDLQESLSPAVVRAVAENAADIGVFGGTTVTTGLQVFPYRSDRLVVIMPPDHPLSRADRLAFRDVARYPLVGPQPGSYLNSLVLRAAADLDHPLKLSIRVNGFEPVRSMVEARLGIGLVPEHHAERYVSSGPLVAVQLDEPWAERHWKICVREAETLPAPVQLFLKHLLASQKAQPATDRQE